MHFFVTNDMKNIWFYDENIVPLHRDFHVVAKAI